MNCLERRTVIDGYLEKTDMENPMNGRPRLPSLLMSAEELTELWGYKNQNVLYNAIKRGSFPIPTYKHGRHVVADVEVVKAYFKKKRDDGLAAVAKDATLHRKKRPDARVDPFQRTTRRSA